MKSGKLNVGDFGDEVASLHANLSQSGFDVSEEEVKRKFFGPATRDAVQQFQKQQGLPVSGAVDEYSATAMNAATSKLNTQNSPSSAATLSAAAGSPVTTATAALSPGILRPGAGGPLPPRGAGRGDSGAPGAGSNGGFTGAAAGGPYRVYGTVALEYGRLAASITLRAYDRILGGAKTLLVEGRTDAQGAYDLHYTAPGVPNLELYGVARADGTEIQLTRTKFRAGTEEQFDVVAPAILQPPDSEFSRLNAAVAPHLQDQNPASLKSAVERGTRQDVSVLASATNWDGRALALASIAYDAADKTAVPPDVLYTLYRTGFPTDNKALARIDPDSVSTALTQAAQTGVIDAGSVQPGVQAFTAFAAAARLAFRPPGKLASLSEYVASAPVAPADRSAFLAVLKEGKPDALWTRAKAAGVSDKGISALQLQGKLAYLTLNNVELTADLQSKLGTGSALQLIDLDFDRPATWSEEVLGLAHGDDAHLGRLIPPAFQGRNNQERLTAYCEELARRVRQMDPNLVTTRQIARGDLVALGPAARVGVQSFLKNAAATQKFRLGQTALNSFVAEHGVETLLPGMSAADRTAALDEVKSLHRLYSVSTSDKALNVLRQNGFKSAFDITRLSADEFARIVGPAIGSTRETQQIYWKAQQQSATIVNIFTGARQLGVSPPLASLSGPLATRDGRVAKAKEKLAGRFPTLESLFGTVDYCECEQCRSVLSPAAYLVDILHFIDPKDPQWAMQKALWTAAQLVPKQDYEATYKKPFDALNARRPDLKDIELTCENTNTAMPYIDIVNEVLERLVVGGFPAIKAFETDTASSADLVAEPQNITWEAYVGGGKPGLKQAVYPATLPFDLPLEMVRAFCRQLDTPLWKLRKLLAHPQTLVAAGGDADGLIDVWFERLGLGPADVQVLTGDFKKLSATYDWFSLYGYQSAADALQGLTDPQGTRDPLTSLISAKTLSRRLGVTYKELIELLQTRFVNPTVNNLVVLHRLAINPHDIERYFNPQPQYMLTPTERSAFEARLAALGVAANDLRSLWTDTVREQTLLLRSPDAGSDFARTLLEFAKTPANASDAIGLALLRLNTFVRLQRKLGWTTGELDSALAVLVRPGVEALSTTTWAAPMRDALIYLAHLDEIAERVGQRVSREELLTLWSRIPTAGTSSLYERLFLGRSALALDPVFDDKLGRYLEGSAELLFDHFDSVSQAFQLSHDEALKIFEAAGVQSSKLSIDNLSILMRYQVLARALDVPVSDLLTYLSFSGKAPLASLANAPVQALGDDVPYSGTLAFLDQVTLLKDAGVDADVLEGICRHRGPTVDADGWPELVDRVLLALSALPQAADAAQGASADELKRVADARQSARLALLQTLSAQLGAPEPLVTTLATNVLKDPTAGTAFADGSMTARVAPLPEQGTSWTMFVWFAAGGSYRLSVPTGVTATLKFGSGTDAQPLVPTTGGFDLTDVRAGVRYRMDLTLSASGAISLQGPATATGIAVDQYSGFAAALLRLRKAIDLLQALGISAAELDYIRTLPAAISLDALPLAPVTDVAAARTTFAGLLPWVDVAAARNRYGAADRVVAVLQAARGTFDQPNQQSAFDAGLNAALAALTGWEVDFIQSARDALGLSATVTTIAGRYLLQVPDLSSGSGLQWMTDAVRVLVRLGLNPVDTVGWARKPIAREQAEGFRRSLKGRYASAAWRKVAQPMFDALRKKQRDTLVAYLTQLPGAPYGETADQVFECLLLDPGTEPPVLASRIQLAISSVQLFVQRCLMNLEATVSPAIIDSTRWEWMSRYRVWEANRKIFIWPENWLDDEFRDDKTHLFRDLEGTLLQGDVSDDLVRTALYTYLQGLETIARVEMMTMYFEPGASADSSTVHVIGRTPNAPYKYFHRQCSHRMWTPWEPIGFDIEGEHLMLTAWRGRMHLFWVTFFEKGSENAATANGGSQDKAFKDLGGSKPSDVRADRRVGLQLNWVERLEGKWTNQGSSQQFLDAANFVNLGASDPVSNRRFSVHVTIDTQGTGQPGDDVLQLHVSHPAAPAQHRFVMFSKLAPPSLASQGSPPTPGAISGLVPSATKWTGRASLTVTFTSDDTSKDGVATSTKKDAFAILEQGRMYSLLFPSNDISIDLTDTVPPAAGRPSGYIFSPQGAQHVVYKGTDSSIHDIWWTPNGWFHTDARAAAGAGTDPATGDPHGYPLDDQHLNCIAYVSGSKVYELSWSLLDAVGGGSGNDDSAGWTVETVYESPANSPAPVGRPLGGLFVPKRGLLIRLADGSLRAAVEGATAGTWNVFTLSVTGPHIVPLAGRLPAAASDPCGAVLTKTSEGVTTIVSRHVFYRSADGHVHELRTDAAAQSWTYTDITEATGAPTAASDAQPAAYAFLGQQTLHVVYRDSNGVIHELWGSAGNWNHNPIGASFGKAEGDPAGYVTEFAGTQHVVYQGTDKQIHELWWSAAGWQENVLTQAVTDAPDADGDPAGYSFETQGSQHVVYRATDGRLKELFWNSDGWHLGQYSLATPYADPIGPLIAPFFYEDQSAPYTFFVEPSLAEKTVHEWDEYVVTAEEYVPDKPPTGVPIKPHFPQKIAITPSALSVLTAGHLWADRILDSDVLVNTPKGVFGAAGGVKAEARFSTTPGTTALRPVQVISTARGLSMAPAKLFALDIGGPR